jgi:DNA-binding MarR family transcriptional regulator
MKPSPDDVLQMVTALMAVFGSLDRARRKGKASALAALQAIASHESVRPSDLALDLDVHPSTVSRRIQTLEEEGLLRATADPEDRRSCFVSLTDAGRDELARLTETGLSRFATFVADWDADEVRELARLLTKLENSKARIGAGERVSNGSRWRKKT